MPGGVTTVGGWPDVWRANLQLRGAGRVLARIGSFRAFHLAQLDKRARKFDWAAVLRPELISEASAAFGAQAVVLSMDVLRVAPAPRLESGYEIVIEGGRRRMGLDAIEWAKRGEELGAGELVINSIDADGTKEGYEITLTRMIAEAVSIPVIASGGGGTPEHLYDVLTEGKADAALVASMLHYDEYTIDAIKAYLVERGIKIRMPREI